MFHVPLMRVFQFYRAIFSTYCLYNQKVEKIDNCKCMPILLYGLECFSFAKHDVRSLDCAVTRVLMKLFRSSNINVIDECRLFFNFMLASKKIEKEESVSRVNSRIVPVWCTILTYVHNYVNIVTVDYLLSCLVKLVKIYSFYSFFQYYQLFWYWWIKDYQ